MTDWLTRQAARTLEAIPVLQPNLASRFTPVEAGEAIAWGEITTSTVSATVPATGIPETLENRSRAASTSRLSSLVRPMPNPIMPLTRVPRQKVRSPLPENSFPTQDRPIMEDTEQTESAFVSPQPFDEPVVSSPEFSSVELDTVQPLIAPQSLALPSNERSPRSQADTTSPIISTTPTSPPDRVSVSDHKTITKKITTEIREPNKIQSSPLGVSKLSNFSDQAENTIQNTQSQLISDSSLRSVENVQSVVSNSLSFESVQSKRDRLLVPNTSLFHSRLNAANGSEATANSILITPNDFSNDIPNDIKNANQTVISSHPESYLDGRSPLLTNSSPSNGSTPTIQVTIGRIEVRAAPQPQPGKRSSASQTPALSLKEYLKQRQGG